MRKIVILAISAIFVANISAQEMKKECCKGKELSKEERVELDIKRFTNELMLSDQQAEKFAVTYREYAAKLDELFEANKPAKFEPGQVLTDGELERHSVQEVKGALDDSLSVGLLAHEYARAAVLDRARKYLRR